MKTLKGEKKSVDMNKYQFYLGKEIKVKVDRPLGNRHPEYGFIYTLNYGYIPETVSEDGEEIDVYILGVFEPVEEFTGVCRAVVHRYDDEENKLIVTPENKEYDVSQMEALVEFQERFFKYKILV
ncbi:MAG: inorganic diphosphatase [Leptotrichiaceae bacterium]|nr:inorganic diphosphatase [Leptotrichiaceae bacterium]